MHTAAITEARHWDAWALCAGRHGPEKVRGVLCVHRVRGGWCWAYLDGDLSLRGGGPCATRRMALLEARDAGVRVRGRA